MSELVGVLGILLASDLPRRQGGLAVLGAAHHPAMRRDSRALQFPGYFSNRGAGNSAHIRFAVLGAAHHPAMRRDSRALQFPGYFSNRGAGN